ncbi:MAG TPA: hypothetical protein VNX21_06770 [Candidatus Thermoplasmatota archaeon]|nr:hypothetical protein [Candidatus Thermoplasmatota archaeon]
MKATLALLVLLAPALLAAPSASADVGVRTCDAPTFCRDLLVLDTDLAHCYVDVMKAGLGRPPGVRLSECA